MIDTICLLIPKGQMQVLSLAGAPAWELQSKTEQYARFVKNPTKANRDTGLWFPRLTDYSRSGYFKDENVKIEISLSKLIYLNSLDELEEKDFQLVAETLQARLRTMGVIIEKSVLENASVCAVHFSKNILLKDGYTASHLISEMNKVNIRKTFDLTRSRYINDGESLCAHTTSHQLIIYDKIADMNKDKKRAIDKDQPEYQLSLFPELRKAKEMIEVIRFEVRLSKKQKMNQVLHGLGYSKNPTFRDVFNAEMSKKVVTDYWNKLIKERNLGLFSVSLSLKDVLRTIYLADTSIKPKQAIYFVGLFMLGKDDGGMMQLRSIVTKNSHDRTWYRLVKDMRIASQLITKNKVRDWVTQIDKSLAEFKAYKQEVLPAYNHYLHEDA